ncbi:hypothetical protein [Endozoicomonas sp. ALC020]|uniref:hypothetical protein n=1 Tax=unclassified Endozoicomonas TaxID=2644528 RepID=UPI003BAE9229
MKRSFFAKFLLLLFSLSATCQADSLRRRFAVEHKQSTQSFSVTRSLNSLLDNRKHLPDTKGYTVLLPPDDKPHKAGGYGLPMTFIESIYWPLLYATNVLLAYELIQTTRDPALRGKPYSWIPEEVFVAVGWLLKSYWNPDSLLFNPRDQLSRDDPFTINTMTLPGENKQQSDQQQSNKQNPPSESSGQQASGTTSHVRGSVTNTLSSGSNDGNESPEQDQHTLGLDCFVNSCHGVCKLRQSSNSSELAEHPLKPEIHEAVAKVASKAGVLVSQIIKHINRLIFNHTLNDVHANANSPSPDIQTFENAIEILELLDPSDISTDLEPFSLYPEIDFYNAYHLNHAYGDSDSDDDIDGYAYYHVYYRGKMLFAIIRTANKTSFASALTCGISVSIKTEVLFNELYYAPDGPGYQSAKREFEEQRKKQSSQVNCKQLL